MTPERWQRVSELYHAVLEADPSQRSALLDSADPEVRSEVEGLLSPADSGTSPLERPVLSHAKALFPTETKTYTTDPATLGPYRIQTLLGRGGMGAVYRAHDPKLGRDVAIKTLPREFGDDPERLSRFRREARVLASLNHPNIAAIYGLEESNGVDFLVLELVEGETLAELLKRTGPMPVNEVLVIMGQVAEALDAAHGKGVTHRDIKPANIKMTPEGRVKVLDFGLAKVVRQESAVPEASAGADTETGRILGTPRYMSPEQARGQDVDPRTDIWAFGCVFYELLTGKHALPGDTVSDIIAAILGNEPDYSTLPEATPIQVRKLMEHCLAKDVDKRLPNIADARQVIEEAQQRPRRQLFTRRRIIVAATAAAAAVVAVAANVGGLRDRWIATGGIRSIAVLPLANLSGDSGQEYFSDGLTESLIQDMARISALKVISRTSVMTYKGTRKPLREIAKELGVDAILQGSAVRSGDRIRINVQLIDGTTDQHLWVESYDRDYADVLVLQSEVARAVAQQVRAQLTPQEQVRLTSARAVNPEAYSAYLQGKFLVNRPNAPQNLPLAQQYFELSLAKDPNYALAHAGLAWVWVSRLLLGSVPREEVSPKAVEAAETALALDSSLAEVHNTLAVMKAWVRWDWAEAEVSFRRAIDLDPNYPDARVYYARLLDLLNRLPEAMPQIERALELDPHNALFRMHHANLLNTAGRYDEAIAQSQRALAAQPDQQQAQNAMRNAYLGKGMLKEALGVALGRTRVTAKGNPEIRKAVQRIYDQGNYQEAARHWASLVEERWRKGQVAAGLPVFFMLAGQPDKLLEWWEWALEQGDPNMPGAVREGGRVFPQLEDNPRYQALLRRMRLP